MSKPVEAMELLPCPFCNGQNHKPMLRECLGDHWVSCTNCEAATKMCGSQDSAVHVWNRRNTPQPLEGQADAVVTGIGTNCWNDRGEFNGHLCEEYIQAHTAAVTAKLQADNANLRACIVELVEAVEDRVEAMQRLMDNKQVREYDHKLVRYQTAISRAKALQEVHYD
jgi:hypothetical protein